MSADTRIKKTVTLNSSAHYLTEAARCPKRRKHRVVGAHEPAPSECKLEWASRRLPRGDVLAES